LKRSALAATFVLLLSCLPAAAQLAVYGKFDIDHYTDTNSNSAVMVYGAGVGIYDNFIHLGPVQVGGDLRGDLSSGNRYSYRSVLIGLPVGVKLPLLPVRPYLEPVAGVDGSKYTGSTAPGITTSHSYKLAYGFVGGVDWTVLPHIDWRVVEAGYTREDNGVAPNPNVLVSSGLVLRF
jgi:hypothetical protein